MTQRVNEQLDLDDFLVPGSRLMLRGGLQGGREREARRASDSHLVVAVHHHPEGVAPDEDFPFWGYWLNDEVVSNTPEAQAEAEREHECPVHLVGRIGSRRPAKAARSSKSREKLVKERDK